MSARTVARKVDIVVIGSGQAGLSSAYHLGRRGLPPHRGFVVLDQALGAGGALETSLAFAYAEHRRPHPRPAGDAFAAVATTGDVQAAVAVPEYFAAYEEKFALPVLPGGRPSRTREFPQRARTTP